MTELQAHTGARPCGGRCGSKPPFDFTMAFQPVVDVRERRIYAYEALVRGPAGEGAGTVLAQVTDENRYAFDQACRVRAIELAARLGLDRRLNINFLPNAVYHPEACLQVTLAAAAEHGFPRDLITFEFTEDEHIIDRRHLRSIVDTYRRHGFMTALDDFGAGYAGLSLLADFQTDVLKIDRMLITGIQADPSRQAVVAGVLLIAERLGMSVVAEGVETAEEACHLLGMGVHRFQGFFFARPQIETLCPDSAIQWDLVCR
ncbi:EAL domain-containing protein [Novispirillum itersonii]|uniref:EAL domain-containing protein n=1 Tax=Novispirillum itersonii TaxID=189 RepID=UPI00037FC0F7|nr:EAL domain-containing protein [Novispirillum itersonii]